MESRSSRRLDLLATLKILTRRMSKLLRFYGVARWARMSVLGAVLCCIDIAAYAETSDARGIRGVVKAQHEALITVDIKSNISALPVRTGESFSKGDVLVSFDCMAQRAAADAARAAFTAAKSRYESNVEMNSFDALGGLEVDLAKAEMDEAAARARGAEALIRQCKIIAPYAGRVAELAVNAHEMPAPDTPLMKIVGTKELELRLIVPSAWLNWMRPGVAFRFEIDETGKHHEARVTNIGAEVDAVSRTVPIIASFANTPATVLPGMSGTARFEQVEHAPSS